MFLWAQQDINTALLARTCGLDPRGLSQWRAGGLELAADGGVISRELADLAEPRTGGMISHERRVWVSRERRRISPVISGLDEPRTVAWTPANGGLGARGQRTCDDPAELPRIIRGLEREDEWRLPCREGQNRQTGTKQNTFKNEKQNEVNGRRLLLGLVFCHGAHSREEQGTQRRGVNSNNSL